MGSPAKTTPHWRDSARKSCPICQSTFVPRPKESQRAWDERVTCSRECGRIRNGQSHRRNRL